MTGYGVARNMDFVYEEVPEDPNAKSTKMKQSIKANPRLKKIMEDAPKQEPQMHGSFKLGSWTSTIFNAFKSDIPKIEAHYAGILAQLIKENNNQIIDK